MRIDPGNKCFIAVFATVTIGVIGFFIASIFLKIGDDIEITTFEFKNSSFTVSVKQFKDDKRYAAQVFNDGRLLQNVILGNTFGRFEVQVNEIENGWEIGTSPNNRISFTTAVDANDFASIYVKRTFANKTDEVTDCMFLDPENLNWYGGPEQMDQRYPIQKFNFTNYAYLTQEFESAAIMERYWLSSNGFFILIDYEAPLFIDQNSNEELIDHICFTGKKELPYDTHANGFVFSYRIGAGINAKETHINVINKMLGKPTGIPDERLVRYPIWNTWVQYGREINESVIRDFAEEIDVHGFKRSLLDIDDLWEVCYGSLTVSTSKFPNLKQLTTDLKSMGFIVGMWVHPFINKNCQPYYDEAINNNLVVKSHNGSTDTIWWNAGPSIGAAHWDFTKPEGRSFYRQKLEAIQQTHGIDIFKFDAGETTWFPEDAVLTGDPNITPSLMTRAFVELASDFGNLLEVRTGWGTQRLHVFVRMLDFDSRWGVNNGLKSLIPTLLQFNLNGYVFVLPDMIGGNRYGNDQLTKPLFIRWLQASVFMPALQFSVPPWEFDEETITIAKKFVALHEEYSDYILELFNLAVTDGHPEDGFTMAFHILVNAPVWWLDPDNKEAQVIDDEYLLGDKILAAPILEENKTERDIFLPAGVWKDPRNNEVYQGSMWIKNYKAELDELPYFIRQT